MHRYFASLAYDGTSYYGWQIQPNDVSVQQLINEVFSIVFREPVETTGCGRTDKGVHATQFYAHFDLQNEIDNVEKVLFQINALLPRDIRVYDMIPVPAEAHARFDAIQRSYSYYIKRKPSPFNNNYFWFNRQRVNVDTMNEAAALCLAHLDFSCFAKSGGNQLTKNCIVSECKWLEKGDDLQFTVTANRFLRGMVRAMVGTFYDVGTGKITLNEFKSILDSKDRTEAGKTVPAQGLFLEEVKYHYLQIDRQYFFQP
jgi:tRNA pseudouridine38-40 synthase